MLLEMGEGLRAGENSTYIFKDALSGGQGPTPDTLEEDMNVSWL